VNLPPEQQNEPEWLQVQRRRQREEHSWNYGGWAAMALAAIPYAILEALLSARLFHSVALVIAVTLTVAAIFFFRRATKGTFQRGFAIWSVVAHGLCVAGFLAMVLR
jgi:hypothetical protein